MGSSGDGIEGGQVEPKGLVGDLGGSGSLSKGSAILLRAKRAGRPIHTD